MPRELIIVDWNELGALSSPMLLRIANARHELVDAELGRMVEILLWARHATGLTTWPSFYADSDTLPKWVGAHGLDKNHIIAFCPKADRPDDPQHQPAEELRIGDIHKYMCSCGNAKALWELKKFQRHGSYHVWPTEPHPTARRVDGVPVAVMLVCPLAPTADHPAHAPNSLGDRCICGHGLDETWFPDDKKLQRLTVQ